MAPAGKRNGAADDRGMARLHLALRGGVRPSLPIGEALHPVAIAAAVVLLVNDWVLKRSAAPGWLTGKLSDVAGLVFAPVAFTAVIGLVLWVAGRAGIRISPWLTRRRLVAAIAATAGLFAVVKLSPAAAARLAAWLGEVVPGSRIVPDPLDLLALPALAIAWWIGEQELRWIHAAEAGRTA